MVEDEPYARKELARLLSGVKQDIQLVGELDSVQSAVNFVESGEQVDLIFLDIQLADGLSFEIFEKTNVNVPVIFTTAYDQFTLKAFKLLSVDYLLKPIDPEQLQTAIDKFEQMFRAENQDLSAEYKEIAREVLKGRVPEYKKRFLGRIGHKVMHMNAGDIAYVMSHEQTTYLVSTDHKIAVDHSLDHMEELLNPDDFFRISRQMIIHVNSVQRMERYGASQWLLILEPEVKERVLVSRARSAEFIAWIDR